VDSKALLRGTRVFALLFNNNTLTIAKVAKTFDPIASSSLLSIKMNNKNIRNVESHHVFQKISKESFHRASNLRFPKSANVEFYSWLTTTLPKQLTKIKQHWIALLGELLHPVKPNLN